MKYFKHIKLNSPTLLLVILAGTLMIACENNSVSYGDYTKELSLTGLRYASPDSAGEVDRIAPGDVVALQGENMNSVVHVYFNGLEATFNPALASNSNLVVTVPPEMPFGRMDPNDENINTIKVTNNSSEAVMEFQILPPGPVVNGIDNEFASAGTEITLTGNFLYLVTGVTFPGGVEATQFEGSADGTWLTVTVPSGVREGGHIVVNTISGNSPATLFTLFRDDSGVFANFDDKNPFTPWSDLPVDTVAEVAPVDGNYLFWEMDNIPVPNWWTPELATPFQGGITWPDYPASTDLTELAFKFEVNVPVGFNSGNILINFGFTYEYLWNEPWMTNSEGQAERTMFSTDGWQTLTVPLELFNTLGAYTYGDLTITEGNPAEFGLFYNNPDTGVPVERLEMYFDNLRIVRIR